MKTTFIRNEIALFAFGHLCVLLGLRLITSIETITRNSGTYLFRVIRRVISEAMAIPEIAEDKELRYRLVLLEGLCYSVGTRKVSRLSRGTPVGGNCFVKSMEIKTNAEVSFARTL